MAGYSETPLAKKLGIKEGFLIQLVNQPVNYFSMFTDFPHDVNVSDTEVSNYDFIHIFSKDMYELNELLPEMKKKIKTNGIIWISWPKRPLGLKLISRAMK